jgi:hypothetical protein
VSSNVADSLGTAIFGLVMAVEENRRKDGKKDKNRSEKSLGVLVNVKKRAEIQEKILDITAGSLD